MWAPDTGTGNMEGDAIVCHSLTHTQSHMPLPFYCHTQVQPLKYVGAGRFLLNFGVRPVKNKKINKYFYEYIYSYKSKKTHTF